MSDNNTNPSTENPFDEFSSKIKRLYIPLPNYQFFHHHTTPEEEDIHFVGRKTIVALLKGWLNPDGNPHGVYLITGSRGMGKTSVVGKAITEVVTEFYKSKKDKNRKKWARIFDNICLVCSFLLVQLLVVGMDLFEKYLWWLCMIIGPMVLYLIVRICQRWRRKYILNISVSVGDEINNERDVLAVIADAIRTTFNEHLMTEYPHSSASLVRKLISFTGIAVFLFLIYHYHQIRGGLGFVTAELVKNALNGIAQKPLTQGG